MNYTHPKKYKGVKLDTTNGQLIMKARVEKYCLKCDLFMGKEHDFSEYQMYDKWKGGEIVKQKTCPFDHIVVSVAQPGIEIKCDSE